MGRTVLIITWRRPDKVSRILKALKSLDIEMYYVFNDGFSRNGMYRDDIEMVRRIVKEEIDSKKLRTCFLDNNIGLRKAVITAIDWYFKNVPEGFIIEEDIVPSREFFEFGEVMLDRYRKNKKIASINGWTSFDDRGGLHYGYSWHAHSWGWCTWGDRWAVIVRDVTDFDVKQSLRKARKEGLPMTARSERSWIKKLDAVKRGEISSWAYLWNLTIWVGNMRCIMPTKRLVDNIGFDRDATHTKETKSHPYKRYSGEIGDPDRMEVDIRERDEWLESLYYRNDLPWRIMRRLGIQESAIHAIFFAIRRVVRRVDAT